jgi:opacity protein-like surface antigen
VKRPGLSDQRLLSKNVERSFPALVPRTIGGEAAQQRRGPADRGKYCEAAGAVAEAVIRSVELIVQADAHDTPKPLSVQVPVQTNAEDVVGEMAAKRGISGVRRRTWARDDYQVQHRFLPGQPDILTSSQNRTGWTLGAGLEYALGLGWSAFAEYDHFDFGTQQTTLVPTGALLLSLQYPFNIHQTMDVVKGGINYRFSFGPH